MDSEKFYSIALKHQVIDADQSVEHITKCLDDVNNRNHEKGILESLLKVEEKKLQKVTKALDGLMGKRSLSWAIEPENSSDGVVHVSPEFYLKNEIKKTENKISQYKNNLIMTDFAYYISAELDEFGFSHYVIGRSNKNPVGNSSFHLHDKRLYAHQEYKYRKSERDPNKIIILAYCWISKFNEISFGSTSGFMCFLADCFGLESEKSLESLSKYVSRLKLADKLGKFFFVNLSVLNL